MPIRRIAVLSGSVLLLLAAGCASPETASGGPGDGARGDAMRAADQAEAARLGMLNVACPVTGRPVNPDARTAAWREGAVGFCCNGCASSWDEMSDVDRAAKLTAVRVDGG